MLFTQQGQGDWCCLSQRPQFTPAPATAGLSWEQVSSPAEFHHSPFSVAQSSPEETCAYDQPAGLGAPNKPEVEGVETDLVTPVQGGDGERTGQVERYIRK